MWGELVNHTRSLTHRPSSQGWGSRCPHYTYIMCIHVCVFGGFVFVRSVAGRVSFLFFLTFFYWASMLSTCIAHHVVYYMYTLFMLFDIVCVYVYLVLLSDFCDKDDGYIRGSDSKCEHPSGDNATRTGLVVGSLLSSLLVLLIWITLVLLWSCGAINKTVPPAATYEEVDVSGEVTSTQKIQLNTNEAYAFRETIPTSSNIAYEQVQL